jgi:hypothetical protein
MLRHEAVSRPAEEHRTLLVHPERHGRGSNEHRRIESEDRGRPVELFGELETAALRFELAYELRVSHPEAFDHLAPSPPAIAAPCRGSDRLRARLPRVHPCVPSTACPQHKARAASSGVAYETPSTIAKVGGEFRRGKGGFLRAGGVP